MSILSSNDGLVTNIEVLHILTTKKSASATSGKNTATHIETLTSEAIKRHNRFPDVGAAARFIKEIGELQLSLTEAETLMLVNSLPTSAVEVHLVIIFAAHNLPRPYRYYVRLWRTAR
jgi:hypothetical protein